MTVFRSDEPLPDWCELQRFAILDLAAGSPAACPGAMPRTRVLCTGGRLHLVQARGSMVLREGQFLDLGAGNPASLHAVTPSAQAVVLGGRWGDDIAGCGVFRVVDEAQPSDAGDPVPYAKTTRMDSHYHDYDEYWIILEGRCTAVVGDRRVEAGRGDCIAIGTGHRHDMPHAPDPVKAVFFETSLQGRRRLGHLWEHTHGPAEPHPGRS